MLSLILDILIAMTLEMRRKMTLLVILSQMILIAVVTNNKYFKANLGLHSRGNNQDAYDPTFYSTSDMQGTIKHEIGHFFGLADRYPDARRHAPAIVDDLMDKNPATRRNAVEPFKRVWKSAGLDNNGSKSVLINHQNREVW